MQTESTFGCGSGAIHTDRPREIVEGVLNDERRKWNDEKDRSRADGRFNARSEAAWGSSGVSSRGGARHEHRISGRDCEGRR